MKSLSILMVEDNLVLQKIQTKLLTNWHHKITLAPSGFDAIEKLQQPNDFDLVLMDVQMPQLNGLQTTQKIRAFNISLPIIALTGNDAPDEIQACFMAGMNGFIAKPINQTRFEAEVQKYII